MIGGDCDSNAEAGRPVPSFVPTTKPYRVWRSVAA